MIPVVFFILLELSLRLFGYGFDNSQWVNATKGKILLNPEVARRYFFSTQNLPYSNQDVFDAVKKKNAFRVFVMGGSSAAGYPYLPIGSFSRYLRQRLQLVYPHSTIEVVNIAMTAVNSYTLRDLMPGVIEQKPDLVIIYAGHNEYYGALGVGSMESLGTSRTMVNLILYLGRFKTVELLRNIIKGVMDMFTEESEVEKNGTLMSRMAKDQYIDFNSEKYSLGLEQFEGNLRDILEMAKDNGVPVMLGTLVSNLKDQSPFVSLKSSSHIGAEDVFNSAKEKLNQNELREADSLFRYAKDLDALRFRAPEKINAIIKKLGKEFSASVVDIESELNSLSPDGITGNNFMTDHLHPTIEGYQIIGKLFYQSMERENLLPKSQPINLSDEVQDSLVTANFLFSMFDSVMADFRIKLLKNDWPFISKKNKKLLSQIIERKNFVDSIAYDCVADKIAWEPGHRKVADYYLKTGDFASFQQQVDILISQYPVVVEYYNFIANELLKINRYDEAYKYISERFKLSPDAFSTKWLGIIDLSKNKFTSAIKYLNQSRNFDSKDDQVLYNLTGAYIGIKDYKSALKTLKECLVLSPNYPGAENLLTQLESAVNHK